MTEKNIDFGQLLRRAREATRLSQRELARRVGLDPSHINRLETGDRNPSREALLTLSEALEIDGENLDKWLNVAGYAPIPLLRSVRGAVRTRGPGRQPISTKLKSSTQDASLWTRLESMGLQETRIRRLLKAVEGAGFKERQEVTKAVAGTFSRLSDALEAPVRAAVIPAAGGQHRLLAVSVMQRLLLRVISEAVEAGISNITLVLSPGTVDALFTPIRQALDLAVVPSIKLNYTEQAKPDGLGDAVLQAENILGNQPFALLLPDDIVLESVRRPTYPHELGKMMEAYKELQGSTIVATSQVPKSKMVHCGVAKLASKEILPKVHPIKGMFEKPEASHPISRSVRAFGIVGRYLLQPEIFLFLQKLKDKGERPVELTDALELQRQETGKVYSFDWKAERQDVGKVLDQARELIGNSDKPLA